MVIIAGLLILSVSAVCCNGQESIASVVLVDARGDSEGIYFAGDDQLNYTEHLKSEV